MNVEYGVSQQLRKGLLENEKIQKDGAPTNDKNTTLRTVMYEAKALELEEPEEMIRTHSPKKAEEPKKEPKEKIEYNNDGSISKIQRFDETGELISVVEYKLLGGGTLNVSSEFNIINGERVHIGNTYYYDSRCTIPQTEYQIKSGKTQKITNYFETGDIKSIFSYTYTENGNYSVVAEDANGNIISTKYYDKNNKEISKQAFDSETNTGATNNSSSSKPSTTEQGLGTAQKANSNNTAAATAANHVQAAARIVKKGIAELSIEKNENGKVVPKFKVFDVEMQLTNEQINKLRTAGIIK